VRPFTRTVQFHGSTVLVAMAVGAQPLSYQWQLNGRNLPGATSSRLTIGAAQFCDGGSYKVIVSNGRGAAVSEAYNLIVQPPQAPVLTGMRRNNGVF